MVKLAAKVAAVNSGSVIDVLPGDIVRVVRDRAGTVTTLSNKAGQLLEKTIQSGAVIDAAALEVQLTVLLRSIDVSTMTNAQKAALLDLVNAGTIRIVDENPWA